MRHPTQSITLQAANDTPGSTCRTQAALNGLLLLMARAELRASAAQGAANSNSPEKDHS